MEKEYLKPEDWYVCCEVNHPGAIRAGWDNGPCWLWATFVPKEWWDKHHTIRQTASKAEYTMLDKWLDKISWTWQRAKKNNDSFSDRPNMPAPMIGVFYSSSNRDYKEHYKEPKELHEEHGVKTADLIRFGFIYNRDIPKHTKEHGELIEPDKLDAKQIARWLPPAIGGTEEKLKALFAMLPSHVDKDDTYNRLRCPDCWKRVSKNGYNYTYKFTFDPNLTVELTTDDYSIFKATPFYKSEDLPYKVTDEKDLKFINFTRRNFNRVPTKKDFEIVAAAVNLLLTLPPGHANTSVIKTLKGSSKATKKRAEYGLAKEYSPAIIEKMVWGLEGFLKDNHLIEFKSMPPSKTGNYEDEAPEWVQKRCVGELELTMLTDYMRELKDKYGV
jgi:hypothetical protein